MLLLRILIFSTCRELKRRKPKEATAKIQLLGEYDPKKVLIIEDPYYVSDTLHTIMVQKKTGTQIRAGLERRPGG